MDDVKEYFIYLLSCFLNGETPEGRKTDFKELYRLSDIHDVSAIIAQELKLIDLYKPEGVYKSMFTQRLGYAVQEYELKTKAKNEINCFLNDNGFKHIFVKGILIRDLYPFKELRSSGDIDVLVYENEFDSIVETLKKSNFKIVNFVSETISIKLYETEIEIHKFADVKNVYFDDVFSLMLKQICNSEFAFNDYDHLLYVICHLAKHLSYRGAGIRMLMDIDVLIRSIKDFDEERFIELCIKARVEKTAKALLSISNYFFNTPVKSYINYNEELELLELFENVLLDGGSFGYETSSIPAKYYDESGSKVKVFLKLAFPSREHLKKAYPYYEKNSLMLPVARINRLTDGLFAKRKTAKSALNELSSNNKNNYQLELLKELSEENKR